MSILSKYNAKIKNAAQRFKRDESGQFIMMFAITGTMLILSGGMAVDGARLYTAKSKLNSAIDAAVLATTQDLTTGKINNAQARQRAQNFLFANLDPQGNVAQPAKIDRFDMDPVTKVVRMDAHMVLPMTFTSIAGYDNVKVSSTASALYNDNKVEIAMALDVTGSMSSQISGTTKINALKDAANGAIETLLNNNAVSDRVRIGLVPYSASVNTGALAPRFNLTDKTLWGCVTERTGPKRFSDDYASSAHPIGAFADETYNCPTSHIIPVTNEKQKLKNEINRLQTNGFTAGHVGIAWTQYMLSEQWNRVWPNNSDVAPKNDKTTQKYAIIMTDGEFNTFLSNNKGAGRGTDESRKYAEKICKQMRDNEIKIFSINFAGGSEARDLMKKCASPDDANITYFYDANSASDLKAAFDTIAASIMGLRLVS